MKLKVLAVLAGWVALLIVAAGPVSAHVTTDPDSAPKGGEITLGFRVPNEEGSANTVQVEVDFPTDHPILGIAVEPLPGWTSQVTHKQLNPPVQSDDGPVTEAVSQIVWSGGSLEPGQFEEFKVLAQQLPKDADQVVFKVLQTYSNADVVRWIDPVQPGQPSPDHPTPILNLTSAAPATGTSTSTTTPKAAAPKAAAPASDISHLAKQSSVDSAKTIGIIGIVIGALGLAAALAALATRRQPRLAAPPPSSGPAPTKPSGE
jgi:periplasmic copper chaperone A